MLPEFDLEGNLPPGGHECTQQEIEVRFCRTGRRRQLCEELRSLIERARNCHFNRIVIWGSFPTAKPEPGDLDLLFIVPRGVTIDAVPDECKPLLDCQNSRENFGHDFLYCNDDPDVVNSLIGYIGFDKATRNDRGVLVIGL